MKIKHKFLEDSVPTCKEIMIIGTFNPDVECNDAKFFYGRAKNFFWILLPMMFDQESLKGDVPAHKEFLDEHDIVLSDLILSVELDEEDICNYADDKLLHVIKYNTQNILQCLKQQKTKEVYFTRKSFDKSVSGIKNEIMKIQEFCLSNGIKFRFLPTPSRFFNQRKILEWKECFL